MYQLRQRILRKTFKKFVLFGFIFKSEQMRITRYTQSFEQPKTWHLQGLKAPIKLMKTHPQTILSVKLTSIVT